MDKASFMTIVKVPGQPESFLETPVQTMKSGVAFATIRVGVLPSQYYQLVNHISTISHFYEVKCVSLECKKERFI